MSRDKTVHDVKSRQKLDQVLFAAAFLVGFVGTLTVKALGADPLYVALVPVLVILTYATLTWSFASVALEPDMIGDNCYYLGFMLTLVSLAWTLYGVSRAPENLDLVREIVSGFGVALASTIVGIFMRAFFLQLRPDIVTSERRARHDVLTAARELRNELSQSVVKLKDFSRNVQQALAEHHGKMEVYSKAAMESHKAWMKRYAEDTAKEIATVHRKSIEEVVSTMSAAAEGASASFKSSLESSANGLQSSVDTLTQQLDQSGARVSESGERFATATQGVTKSISTFGTGIDESAKMANSALTDASSAFSQTLSDSATDFAQFNGTAAGQFHDINKQLHGSSTQIKESSAMLANAGEQIVRIVSSLEAAERKAMALRNLPSETEANNATTALEEAVRELRHLTKRLEGLGKFPSEIQARNVATTLGEAVSALHQLTEQVKGLPIAASPANGRGFIARLFHRRVR